MGYNGGINKRGYYRREHGMYKKSSYRFGEKILSNFIKGGISLLVDLADPGDLSSCNLNDSPQISINDSIIQSLTSNKFSVVRDNYFSTVCRNQLFKKRIFNLRLKIILNYFLRILCYLIPKYRCSFNEKIKAYSEEVKLTENEVSEQIIDVSNLLDDNCQIDTLINRGKIRMTFYNVCNKAFLNGYINITDEVDKYFKCSTTAIGELKSKQIQLYLYSKGIVVMNKKVFAVVDYENISSNYSNIYVKTYIVEDGIRDVGTTWRYAKADGDRDLRYKDNYEINIVEYGCLRLYFDEKFTINVLFSDASYGKEVSKLFSNKSVQSSCTINELYKQNSKNRIEENFIDDYIKITFNKAETTDVEDRLITAVRDYGKPLNSRIAFKYPTIGSSVKRRGDGAILQVINITSDNKFKCFDFEKNDCFLYKRDELMLY